MGLCGPGRRLGPPRCTGGSERLMQNGSCPVMLGAILCERCGTLLEEIDTEKVIVYYHRCNDCAVCSTFDKIGGESE
nr:GapA-binding peptide SR1P [Paenibacillus thiaminolyticus]